MRVEILLLTFSWIGNSSSGLSKCLHGKCLILELSVFIYGARSKSSSALRNPSVGVKGVVRLECSTPKIDT